MVYTGSVYTLRVDNGTCSADDHRSWQLMRCHRWNCTHARHTETYENSCGCFGSTTSSDNKRWLVKREKRKSIYCEVRWIFRRLCFVQFSALYRPIVVHSHSGCQLTTWQLVNECFTRAIRHWWRRNSHACSEFCRLLVSSQPTDERRIGLYGINSVIKISTDKSAAGLRTSRPRGMNGLYYCSR